MLFQPTLFLASVASLAAAAVLPDVSPAERASLSPRLAELCGQWDNEAQASGRYLLYNNLWGKGTASGGSQCTQATSVSGNNVAWKTSYSWQGGPGQVKSYANVALKTGLGKKLSAIKSIPTTWKWKYTSASSDLISNVSIDTWLSPTTETKDAAYELMIWPSARGGALPAGSQVATVTIAGTSWRLFKGNVATWVVYSFVSNSGEITNFNADVKLFFNYLVANWGVSPDLLVSDHQAGTEPFSGQAVLTTTSYTTSINV